MICPCSLHRLLPINIVRSSCKALRPNERFIFYYNIFGWTEQQTRFCQQICIECECNLQGRYQSIQFDVSCSCIKPTDNWRQDPNQRNNKWFISSCSILVGFYHCWHSHACIYSLYDRSTEFFFVYFASSDPNILQGISKLSLACLPIKRIQNEILWRKFKPFFSWSSNQLMTNWLQFGE